MLIIIGAVFAMVYDCLTYIPPVSIPQWQLPGIADKNFVTSMTIVLGVLFLLILLIYKSLPKDK